jgi:DNA-binding IclR family transcriptional regulator
MAEQLSGARRLLGVLGCFTPERVSLTMSEISRLQGIPLTTTHRLVTELAEWGALDRDESGRYSIGLRVWEVGSLAPRRISLREAALPFMEDLYEVTHENVQIAVLDASEVVYVERISGRLAVPVVTLPGSRLAAHATASGILLLAHARKDDVDAVLAQPLRSYTQHTLTDPQRIRRAIADARRHGYVVNEQQIDLAAASVAAPVRDSSQAVVAALSIVVHATSSRARRYVPAVLAAARGISRVLGATA